MGSLLRRLAPLTSILVLALCARGEFVRAQSLGSWIDFNDDGISDYCSVDSTQQLFCVLGTKSGGPGERLRLSFGDFDLGYQDGRSWADVDGDGHLDYCRIIGLQNRQGFRCDTGDGRTVSRGYIQAFDDWGYAGSRVWADEDGDRSDDFCRNVGNAPNIFPVCSSVDRSGPNLRFGSYRRVSKLPRPRPAKSPSFPMACISNYPFCEPQVRPTPTSSPGDLSAYIVGRYYCESVRDGSKAGTCDLTTRGRTCDEARNAQQKDVESRGDICQRCQQNVIDNTKRFSGYQEEIQLGPCKRE